MIRHYASGLAGLFAITAMLAPASATPQSVSAHAVEVFEAACIVHAGNEQSLVANPPPKNIAARLSRTEATKLLAMSGDGADFDDVWLFKTPEGDSFWLIFAAKSCGVTMPTADSDALFATFDKTVSAHATTTGTPFSAQSPEPFNGTPGTLAKGYPLKINSRPAFVGAVTKTNADGSLGGKLLFMFSDQN